MTKDEIIKAAHGISSGFEEIDSRDAIIDLLQSRLDTFCDNFKKSPMKNDVDIVGALSLSAVRLEFLPTDSDEIKSVLMSTANLVRQIADKVDRINLRLPEAA